MNRLIADSYRPDQILNRGHRLQRYKDVAVLKYMAPNRYVFTIDARPLDCGGVPRITSSMAEGYSTSHDTHTLGDGVCCIADPSALRQMDLCTLLIHIDSWARGMELYKKGFGFPASPKQAFARTYSGR